MSNASARQIYKSLSGAQTHLVYSSEIATACLCPFAFRLSYPFGVTRGHGDYLVGNTVHDILSVILPLQILEKWTNDFNDPHQLVNEILGDSDEIVSNIIDVQANEIKNQGKIVSMTFEDDCRDRINGILVGFCKRIMKKYPRPRKTLSEIAITNVTKHHEGILDGILEFDDGEYAVIDWKSYNMNPASSSGHDRWQLIANMLLANYRYTNDEDNWSRCKFGSVIYYTNAYIPKFPLQQEWISKVQEDRLWAYQTLSGDAPYKPKPSFCHICDTGAAGSDDCQFYKDDSQLARYGNLNAAYEKVRSKIFWRRYVVLEERAITHRYKYLTDILIKSNGEQAAINELERLGILQTGFKIEKREGCDIILKRDGDIRNFSQRKPLRIIGIEDNIPLLARVNAAGSVKEVSDEKLIVQFYRETAALRAVQQLSGLPVMVMLNEINLTRRLLGPLHKFHRFAASALNNLEIGNDAT